MRTNHDQIRLAKMHGLSTKLIAERLECSERTVRRATADLHPCEPCIFAGTDLEWTAWHFYHELGYSYRKLGKAFCLSHEHIRQTLNEKSGTQDLASEKNAA